MIMKVGEKFGNITSGKRGAVKGKYEWSKGSAIHNSVMGIYLNIFPA
jgi:hypothetical protein